MKTLRNLTVIFGLVMLAFLYQPAASFAHEGAHSEADIQMLRDAATALKATNPDLSEKLSKYADQEEGEATDDTDMQDKGDE